MHQLDCMLIYGAEHLGIKGFLTEKEDLGVSIMPQGVSFELKKDGLPKRTGSRKAHTSGWFWGIPKNSPQPELAYKLAMLITSYKYHLEESRNFYLIPIRKSVRDTLKADLNAGWQAEVYTKSFEQFKINGDHLVPRFKTLADYKDFLHNYYAAFEQIVIKKRYSLAGSEGRVDRNFIKQYLEKNEDINKSYNIIPIIITPNDCSQFETTISHVIILDRNWIQNTLEKIFTNNTENIAQEIKFLQFPKSRNY